MSDARFPHDAEKASAVIAAIVNASGGKLKNRLHLYKAFVFAHVEHLSRHGRLMTDWPIVRMPKGPGVGNIAELTHRLSIYGLLEENLVKVGAHDGYEYELLDRARAATFASERLNALELESIDAAANDPRLRETTSRLSDRTHQDSVAWQSESANGRELDVGLDLFATMDDLRSTQQATDDFEKDLRRRLGS